MRLPPSPRVDLEATRVLSSRHLTPIEARNASGAAAREILARFLGSHEPEDGFGRGARIVRSHDDRRVARHFIASAIARDDRRTARRHRFGDGQAAYHGAAHQKPQVFQVMVPHRRRPIACGKVRIQFISRSDMAKTPVIERNTSRGTIKIASAAATALEVVGYLEHGGGLSNVATVLAELAESVDAEALVVEAHRAPLSWVQRLGYLLSLVEASELAAALDPVLVARKPFAVALAPSAPRGGSPSDPRWKVAVNVHVEPDL